MKNKMMMMMMMTKMQSMIQDKVLKSLFHSQILFSSDNFIRAMYILEVGATKAARLFTYCIIF